MQIMKPLHYLVLEHEGSPASPCPLDSLEDVLHVQSGRKLVIDGLRHEEVILREYVEEVGLFELSLAEDFSSQGNGGLGEDEGDRGLVNGAEPGKGRVWQLKACLYLSLVHLGELLKHLRLDNLAQDMTCIANVGLQVYFMLTTKLNSPIGNRFNGD